MPSDWRESARRIFGASPGLAGQILRDRLKVDLPAAIEYTLLTPLCGDDARGEAPIPEMVLLAGPPGQPARAVIVEFQERRDEEARRRWPLYAAAVWLCHGCPVDLLVVCPDELTAHWADRPVATTLEGYVCRPVILILEDPGTIAG